VFGIEILLQTDFYKTAIFRVRYFGLYLALLGIGSYLIPKVKQHYVRAWRDDPRTCDEYIIKQYNNVKSFVSFKENRVVFRVARWV
jgi:hypothetical protein